MKELPSIFKGLKVHKIKSRRRGNQLWDMNSLSKKKVLITGLMTNTINQETQKTPVGSKIPDWYDPDYKNETTPESQKELERIKQESLDKMKN